MTRRWTKPPRDDGQLSLLDQPAPIMPAFSHRADPDTSRQASRKLTASGRLTEQRARVLNAVRAQPVPATSSEIAWRCEDAWPIESERKELRSLIAKRLPELEKLGFVRRCPARTCKRTGNNATTWEGV